MIDLLLDNDYLPLSDVLWYVVMVVACIVIFAFWYYVMSNLGDR